ncbi:hypothetical protein ACFE04_015969 [Oxalis oulophora]
MDPSISGRGAAPVFRDKDGNRISKEEYSKLKEKRKEKPKEIKLEWGKGLVQKREAEAKMQQLEFEKENPFARTRDDPDLDRMMKDRLRWGDPMAHLVEKKQHEPHLLDLGDNEKMQASGFVVPQGVPNHSWIKRGLDAAPNRYAIKPGRHWDGVDRSTRVMNPPILVKRIQSINSKEAELGISEDASWHAEYKDSAYVYAGGIPFDLTEGDLLAVFAQYGEIVDINLVRDKGTGKSKGFAFVAYEDQRSTILAVDNLNGAQILGRMIKVDHVTKYKKTEEQDEETQQQKRAGFQTPDVLSLNCTTWTNASEIFSKILGVANAIDLADRFLPRLQSLNSASGDMMKALSVCRSALEILDGVLREFTNNDDSMPPEKHPFDRQIPLESLKIEEAITVKIDHMAAALSRTFRSPIVDTIQSLPLHQQVCCYYTVVLQEFTN